MKKIFLVLIFLLLPFHCKSNSIQPDSLIFQETFEYKIDFSFLEQLCCNRELYGDNWNTERVNPYNPNSVPNEYLIDLSFFFYPIEYNLITSHFGYREKMKRMHNGVDLKLYIGDTVKSVFGGKVRIVKYDPNGYGYYIVIRHGNGLETIYGHLSKQLVTTNQYVCAGEPIGLGGNTGRSTGSHLHFETRIVGKPINPELLIDFPNKRVHKQEYLYKKIS